MDFFNLGILCITTWTWLSLAFITSIICNVFLMQKIRNKLKGFYSYFCNIIGFLFSTTIIFIIIKFSETRMGVLLLSIVLLISSTAYTNPKIINKLYETNKKYKDKAALLIYDNRIIFFANLVVWLFYFVSVIINELLKNGIIVINDEIAVIVFQTIETSFIIYLAAVAVVVAIKKLVNSCKLIKIRDKELSEDNNSNETL